MYKKQAKNKRQKQLKTLDFWFWGRKRSERVPQLG